MFEPSNSDSTFIEIVKVLHPLNKKVRNWFSTFYKNIVLFQIDQLYMMKYLSSSVCHYILPMCQIPEIAILLTNIFMPIFSILELCFY